MSARFGRWSGLGANMAIEGFTAQRVRRVLEDGGRDASAVPCKTVSLS